VVVVVVERTSSVRRSANRTLVRCYRFCRLQGVCSAHLRTRPRERRAYERTCCRRWTHAAVTKRERERRETRGGRFRSCCCYYSVLRKSMHCCTMEGYCWNRQPQGGTRSQPRR
jgi:hypothetical protein